ncbi:MAG TPA: metalloregulator ArsR/SmtB family transcription factor [Naasia sp.]|jgi:ArsR family transcriptional regulator
MDEFVDLRGPLYEVKANLFRGLAHPVRIRVLELLSASPEVSVSEMLDATGLESSHLSQHLAVLRRYDLVVGERRGLQVFYSLTDPRVAELLAVAKALLGGMLERTTTRLTDEQGAYSAMEVAAS